MPMEVPNLTQAATRHSCSTLPALFPALVLSTLGLIACAGEPSLEKVEAEAPVLLAPGERPSLELPEIPTDRAVRGVILIVADGLGFAQVTAAREAVAGVDDPLLFERFPYTGWQTTHALEGSVTDSAASATAMATGRKTWSGRVGVDAEGKPLTTLVEAARSRGLATGLVTTSYLLDATPAAFVAHVESRKMRQEIAAQMAASGVDLLIGERGKTLKARKEKEPEALGFFRQAGYSVAETWEATLAAPTGPLLGLLPRGAVADLEQEPALGDLAVLALERLAGEGSEAGFFLLLEDEEPDSGGHREDLSRVLASVRALEGAARVAVDLAARRGDILVLLTSDHETGGLVLERAGRERPPAGRFTGDRHTGVPVPIYAYGAGSHRFTGVLDNTEIALRIAELLGLELDPPAEAIPLESGS